ncbi:MAG: RNA polymerase sigma-54 factor, partial [Negativicutes bacterium]|nr:RNA polymerase sigma-54 factor [Negativicutes bacterium]
MRMDYGLRQELSQKLVMTPQLRQAIAILQLSSLELVEMIEAELLENPVLEVEDNRLGEVETEQLIEVDGHDLASEYLEWAKYLDEGVDTGYMPVEEQKTSTEFYGMSAVPLHEHLEFQLHLATLDARARRAGEYLIGCIDDNGYLQVKVEEAAAAMAVPVALVEEVLALIQTFDPPGVGARDLRECLMIQVRQRGLDDPIMQAIIDSYLADIAAGRLR